jgi:hypothetical protein
MAAKSMSSSVSVAGTHPGNIHSFNQDISLDNAGVMNPPFKRTEDDLELQSQVVSITEQLACLLSTPMGL